MTPKEKIFFIETRHARLAAVLHEAVAPRNKLVASDNKLVIISHGYTGNKQESARLFVTMARTLAANGINAFRFDFMGSGDSSGEFYEMSPNTEIRDLLDVIAWARRKKYRDIGLIGLSFGGAVSICASAQSPDVKTLVTWSAVPGFSDWRPGVDEHFSKTSPNPMKPGKIFYTDRPKTDVPHAYCSLLIPKLQIQGDNDLPGFREEFAFFFPRAKGIKKHIVIPKADHTFTTWPHRKRVLATTLNWFQKYL